MGWNGGSKWTIVALSVFALLIAASVTAAVLVSIGNDDVRDQRTLRYDESAVDEKLRVNDQDGDAIPDVQENLILSTNRLFSDSDNDGMPDAWERNFGLNPNFADDGAEDADRDGLTNREEYEASVDLLSQRGFDALFDPKIGLNPHLPDTDGDDLPDAWEYNFGLDPLTPSGEGEDTDGDGLTHREEFEAGSNPNVLDTDGDNLNDGLEVKQYGTNPASKDTDLDTMDDDWEVEYKLNPTNANDRFSDPDLDGLPNVIEFARKTHPLIADSDADGMPDGWEVDFGLDPNDFADGSTDPDADGLDNRGEYEMRLTIYEQSTDPLAADVDGDGLGDGRERTFGTNPFRSDTDGDGLTDGDEIDLYGTNPLTKDTDGDGLTDGDEIFVTFTVAHLFDSDSDQIDDGSEWLFWASRQATGKAQLENQGIVPSLIKVNFPTADASVIIEQMGPFGDPDKDGIVNILDGDSDGDNLFDGQEIVPPAGSDYGCTGPQGEASGTDPVDDDTDSDGLPDGWEVKFMLRPCDPDDANQDLDRDGVIIWGKPDGEGGIAASIRASPENRWVREDYTVFQQYIAFTNLHEYQNNTNPLSPDTDCDVMPDGWEVFFAKKDSDTGEILPNPRGVDSDSDMDRDGYDYQGGTRNGRPAGDGIIRDSENFTSLEEWYYFTDPWNNNTDAAGEDVPEGEQLVFLRDGAEVYFAQRQQELPDATVGLPNNGVSLLSSAGKTKQVGLLAGCYLDYSKLSPDPAMLASFGAPLPPTPPGPSGGAGILAVGLLALLSIALRKSNHNVE